jgi:hypothetical protein
MAVQRFLICLAALVLATSRAFAMDSCSCKNLESLQQELKNAIYETGFFDSLSQRLDAIEKKQAEMESGKCTQNAADLEAMRKGSACQEIADITLKHEEAHRTLCTSMGADRYWGRMPSEIAAEEAQRYRATGGRPTPCAPS